MTNNIKSKESELFLDLSNQQQEKVSGGNFEFMFFQQTDILSFANSAINIVEGSLGISVSNQALYQFSQKTLILASLSSSFNPPSNFQSKGINLLNNLFS
ncbi:hypothetical protein [Anabaena sp. CCY 0017]|uniref:hypothetical protein n=1 Tax=Anabaena sp. CCY 0017 TaxID=3103866 RepID=UPI0039C69339